VDILANLGIGFANALQPVNFLMICLGLLIGIVAGALPGITMINSIVLVLPFNLRDGYRARSAPYDWRLLWRCFRGLHYRNPVQYSPVTP